MKLLAEIRESDIGLKGKEPYDKPYKLRKAARAVILDDKGRVAMLHVTSSAYHKLPGGGLEPAEDVIEALASEANEETGCSIKVTDEIGVAIEYRNEFEQLQISYCYLAKLAGDTCEPSFTQEEQDEGFRLQWAGSLDDAIRILDSDTPESYMGKMIRYRDLKFLIEAKRILG